MMVLRKYSLFYCKKSVKWNSLCISDLWILNAAKCRIYFSYLVDYQSHPFYARLLSGRRSVVSGGLHSASLHSGPSHNLLRHCYAITCILRAPPPIRVRGWTRPRTPHFFSLSPKVYSFARGGCAYVRKYSYICRFIGLV